MSTQHRWVESWAQFVTDPWPVVFRGLTNWSLHQFLADPTRRPALKTFFWSWSNSGWTIWSIPEIYKKSEHHVTYVNLKDSERMGSRWLKPSDHRCYLGLPRPDAARRIAAVSWASQIQAWRHTRQQWESGYDGNIISMDISAIRMGIQ